MVLMSRQQIIVGLMVVLLVFVIPQYGPTTQAEEGQITIVFDFSHDQTFSHLKRNFTQALDFFGEHPEYGLRIIEEGDLTAENLSRSHILVIPNPGKNYSISELEVITNYVSQGGSLFLLSDFQVADRQIGNPVALNAILLALEETRIRFNTFKANNETQGDAIIDVNNSLTLPYIVRVNDTYINTDPPWEILGLGITSIIIAGGSLTTDDANLIISTGAETSQSVAISGQPIQNQPGWLAAFEIGNARIVLSTSNTMFTDTICVGTNQSWFQSMNNTLLWQNIFRWMVTPLIQDPTLIMIFFVVLVLLAGFIIFVYSLRLKRRGR